MATSTAQVAKTGKFGDLRRRLVFLLLALVVYRVGAHIPVPGIDPAQLQALFKGQQGGILNLFNMFSGGALSRFTVFALGIMPYISASIIMQLMGYVLPAFEQMKKEGEAGRRKMTQYTRYGTVGLALFQSIGIAIALESSPGLVLNPGFGFRMTAVVSLTAGTMFLMWLGEQITERGVGNGISMLIFAGIVAGMPSLVGQSLESVSQGQATLISLLVLSVLALFVCAAIVFMERAQRRIPVNYAQKQQQGRKVYAAQQSHLPLKINMAGVIPAIFASSLLLFPASLGQWVGNSPNPNMIQSALQDVALVLSPGQPLYLLLFGAMIIFFCYFYTALVFSPKEVAENLKRSGAYVPGIRPGDQTMRYLDHVLNRLTFIGAIYITVVCLLPMVLQAAFGIPFHLGGTSLLIVVVVVMDFMAQLQAHLTSQQYQNQSLMKKGSDRD